MGGGWGGEERQGSAGSGLLVLSCERQTFGRVITRCSALGVISDSCLFKVFGAQRVYGLCLPCFGLMFRLHLHQGGGREGVACVNTNSEPIIHAQHRP